MQRIKAALALVLGVVGSVLSAQSSSESDIYFVHSDHLGTPQVLTDKDQNIVWQANYTPFGEADIVVEQVEMPLRFPGQYYDQETGYHYNYYRTYDPSTGRYLQSDPIGILRDYSDPQMKIAEGMGIPLQTGVDGAGLNHLYGYVEQNPVNKKDPLGLRSGLIIAFSQMLTKKNMYEYGDDFSSELMQCIVTCLAPSYVDVAKHSSESAAGMAFGQAGRAVMGTVFGAYDAYDKGSCINDCLDQNHCPASF